MTESNIGRLGLPTKHAKDSDRIVALKISKPERAYGDARRHGYRSMVAFVADKRPMDVVQHLNDRGSEPWKAWKRDLGPALLRHFGLEGTGARVTYSRRAGCAMCPCSPGLVIRDIPDARRLDLAMTMVTVTAVAYDPMFDPSE